MAVLVHLAERPGEVVSRRDLERALWSGRIVTEDAVTNAIIKLRRALGDDARRPHIIETIPKTGYRLIADVVPARDTRPTRATLRRRWGGGPALVLLTGLVLVAVGAWWLPRTDDGESGIHGGPPTVAVLPFRNLNTGDGRDWFASGVTTDLVTDLSRVSGLVVMATGAFGTVGEPAADGKLAGAPGADYLVRGSVQRSAERVRINVRLLDAASHTTLWAERFDRPMADVFHIQDEVAAAIVAALEVRLKPAERTALVPRPVTSVAAYEAFLRGLDHYGRRSREDNRLAREHFEHAVGLDPGFGRAHAGLALVHARLAMDGWSAEPAADLDRARVHARDAVAIDPDLHQAHFARAQVELFSGNHRAAIEAAERALDLAPGYADARALLGWVLHYAGRSDQALAALDLAASNHPRMPASYLEMRGEVRYTQGRDGDAAELLERVLLLNPAHLRARLWLAATRARSGELDEARWQITEALSLDPDLSLSRLSLSFPFKDPAHLEQLQFGLRRAGLPP